MNTVGPVRFVPAQSTQNKLFIHSINSPQGCAQLPNDNAPSNGLPQHKHIGLPHYNLTEHCWHDIGSWDIGTIVICCQCAPDWLRIVRSVREELTETLKEFQQQHPIYIFTEVPTSDADDEGAIASTKEEKFLRVIQQ